MNTQRFWIICWIGKLFCCHFCFEKYFDTVSENLLPEMKKEIWVFLMIFSISCIFLNKISLRKVLNKDWSQTRNTLNEEILHFLWLCSKFESEKNPQKCISTCLAASPTLHFHFEGSCWFKYVLEAVSLVSVVNL